MPTDESRLLTCYNRGCGQKYDPDNNNDDSCRFHPGEPFFHDAYKGWTCCKKKCTDFTEFLNFPGCTLAKHSNIKPVEPAKPVKEEIIVEEPVIRKPFVPMAIERPSFDSQLTVMKPILAPSVKQQLTSTQQKISETNKEPDDLIIYIGIPCQNNGCKVSYEGPSTDETVCIHHPGCPIFHEGLKFWSCCQKRTSDFQAFLNQEGCTTGKHQWHKKEKTENVECRWDWHQTGNDVVISIYAKEYCPTKSIVKLNPVRVYVDLVFPKENDSVFNLDLETRGIIKVEESTVTMFGTKVEIKLKKAELHKWDKLEIPREKPQMQAAESSTVDTITPQMDTVDLDDL